MGQSTQPLDEAGRDRSQGSVPANRFIILHWSTALGKHVGVVLGGKHHGVARTAAKHYMVRLVAAAKPPTTGLFGAFPHPDTDPGEDITKAYDAFVGHLRIGRQDATTVVGPRERVAVDPRPDSRSH